MLNRESGAENAIRAALEPTGECPTVEELESFASGKSAGVNDLSGHLQTCTYCQTELHLLRTFMAEDPSKAEPEARKAAELLGQRSKQIFKQAFPASEPTPWWKPAFSMRWMAQASLAAAAVLLVAGAVMLFRSSTSHPQLEAKNPSGQEVYRSNAFALLGPEGDVQERPDEIRWQRSSGAAKYQVRLVEVDRTELWKAETTDDHIQLPATVRNKIVPAKTLFAEVTAFDASGSQLGTTGLVRFRLVHKGS